MEIWGFASKMLYIPWKYEVLHPNRCKHGNMRCCIQNAVNTMEMTDSRSGSRTIPLGGMLRDRGPGSYICVFYFPDCYRTTNPVGYPSLAFKERSTKTIKKIQKPSPISGLWICVNLYSPTNGMIYKGPFYSWQAGMVFGIMDPKCTPSIPIAITILIAVIAIVMIFTTKSLLVCGKFPLLIVRLALANYQP